MQLTILSLTNVSIIMCDCGRILDMMVLLLFLGKLQFGILCMKLVYINVKSCIESLLNILLI